MRIRRADLPEQNSQAVYQRMQTERQREAAEYRAQGSQKSAGNPRQGRPRRDRAGGGSQVASPSRSAARATPTRNEIFADAYRPGSGFLRLLPLDAGLRNGPEASDTQLVLKPDSDFFRYFDDPSGKRRRTAKPAATPRRRPPDAQPRRAKSMLEAYGPRMSDFLAAIGLVFVIEGLIFAAFPRRPSGRWRL